MASNRAVDERLKAGIEAARRGDRANAQKILRQVVTANPDNEVAWMWLASVADSLQERRACLERALRINPNNSRAQEALRQLETVAPRPGGRAPAARQPRPVTAERRFNPLYLVVGGLVVLAIIAAVLISGALNQPPERPNEATLAVFNQLVNTATPTASPDPDTFTATPFYGVIVDNPSPVWTLPPTFTPTFTPTLTPQPPATATPLPVSVFNLLYTGVGSGSEQPALFSAAGDGSNAQRVGPANEGFSDVAYSPNGERIAFVRTVTYSNDGVEVTAPELFLAPASDPGSARQITRLGGTKLESPTWAPDSIQLVFVSDAGGDDNLWYITEDGNNLRPMTTNPGTDRDPAWSPVSDVIVYASDQGGRPGSGITQIFSITSDGATITQLTSSGNSSYSPAWSPDGSRVVFASDRDGDGDIFLMDPDGQRPFRLTVDDGNAEDRDPVFSPDGRWVVFLSNRDGDTFQLYRVDLEGRSVERLSDIRETIQSFAFRPVPPGLR
ncbi:MAG: PD40 domain-containing protein [Chloroflexi bacterium]|nr:PD40 domain-containing protein [Chloroflexota bacterium]